MISLILTIALVGLVCYLILQIPMPPIFHNVILAVVAICLILYVLNMLGVHTGIGSPGLLK